jgi:hypothetical protein
MLLKQTLASVAAVLLLNSSDFTMRGVTKELRLPAKMSKPTKDP